MPRRAVTITVSEPQARLLLGIVRYSLKYATQAVQEAYDWGYPKREHQMQRDMLERIEANLVTVLSTHHVSRNDVERHDSAPERR